MVADHSEPRMQMERVGFRVKYAGQGSQRCAAVGGQSVGPELPGLGLHLWPFLKLRLESVMLIPMDVRVYDVLGQSANEGAELGCIEFFAAFGVHGGRCYR